MNFIYILIIALVFYTSTDYFDLIFSLVYVACTYLIIKSLVYVCRVMKKKDNNDEEVKKD